MRTRCKDKHGEVIIAGDVVHVEEYPGKWIGGSLDFEGVVTKYKGKAIITYFDIGEEESFPLTMFPVEGREILSEKERYEYWKTALLGGEPPAILWKRELYEAIE